MSNNSKENNSASKTPKLTISRDDAKIKIEARIKLGNELQKKRINSNDELKMSEREFSKWDSYNTQLLKTIFSTDEIAMEYDYWLGFSLPGTFEPISRLIEDHKEDIMNHIHKLEKILHKIDLYQLESETLLTIEKLDSKNNSSATNKVFIVHGHDDTAKLSLENFIYSLGLVPVVLHRQPDGGRTIIEKFEQHANEIFYAFILMTPDEVTYLSPEEGKEDKDRKKEFRARPNVIFEFGFFVGALTRKKVCCIHTGNVTLPSDLSGLVYKGYRNSIEEIKHELRQELIHAGLELKD